MSLLTGLPFLADVRDTVQPVQQKDVHLDMQEMHIEIIEHNAGSETLPIQVDSISSLTQYYTNACKEESPPVQEIKCYHCDEKFLCFKALYNHSWSKHSNSRNHPCKVSSLGNIGECQ